MKIDLNIKAADLNSKLQNLWKVVEPKIHSLDKNWNKEKGSPVFTVEGKYTSRGWTEWTQGFQFGSALLHFEATGVKEFYEMGKRNTLNYMAAHVTHTGVHDHGFNNISTYGNLRRQMRLGLVDESEGELHYLEMALKCSGAVQASRWTELEKGGYVYSFNGPHSLFADTIRSMRALALSHQLGHVLMGEKDRRINLLERLIAHAITTAEYNVYYGENRDAYDVCGRVAHESVFNTNDGSYRCPNSQQGYSPFTTWTRGAAWIICGYPEQLEFLETISNEELAPLGGREKIESLFLKAAQSAADYYLEYTPTDGIPYWDTGAPGLAKMGDYLSLPSNPFNDHEPVDSSSAAIAAQGFLRLGRFLNSKKTGSGDKYWCVGLQLLGGLLQAPYLSEDANHQGILLHSVYHRPNGWDHIPSNGKVPQGEACMWGDYHLLETALYVQKQIDGKPYYQFFDDPTTT